jgi:5-(carboxyamino)imidazole ribonucleotide synthase
MSHPVVNGLPRPAAASDAPRAPRLQHARTVGVLGGGQLARMLALAGVPLGLRFVFLDPAPDACAAGLGEHLCGAYDDPQALLQFARKVDLVTYEFENVPVSSVAQLAEQVPVCPGVRALAAARDRLYEKTLFNELDIPTPEFAQVDSLSDLERAVARLGLPAVLKTRSLGYDGKGQRVLREPRDLAAAWEALGGAGLILEAFVPFERELSLLGVRDHAGGLAFYPLAENQHRDGILRLSRCRPGDALEAVARAYVRRLLEHLDYVGVLALELFQVGGRLLANEMAPRVHNSGHWTIEGAQTSQFENHLRAILGLPLGDTAAVDHSAMVNLVGRTPEPAAVLALPGAHLHLYGKSPRPGRKLGHVTLRTAQAEDLELTLDRLLRLAEEATA